MAAGRKIVVDVVHQFGQVVEKRDDVAAVDVIKLVAPHPLVLGVINFELAIRRHILGLDRAEICPYHIGRWILLRWKDSAVYSPRRLEEEEEERRVERRVGRLTKFDGPDTSSGTEIQHPDGPIVVDGGCAQFIAQKPQGNGVLQVC